MSCQSADTSESCPWQGRPGASMGPTGPLPRGRSRSDRSYVRRGDQHRPSDLTMALSYLRERIQTDATVSLFVRDLPPGRGFLVAAGLEPALDYLLAAPDRPRRRPGLRRRAAPPAGRTGRPRASGSKGRCGPCPKGASSSRRVSLCWRWRRRCHRPSLWRRIYATSCATRRPRPRRAARCVLAAQERSIVDLSLRRNHGPQAGVQATRLRTPSEMSGGER